MIEELLQLPASWEVLKATDLPIVLYGTGNGADKIVDRFAALSIPLYGVAASDGFVRHRTFRGFTVRPISAFEAELADFIIVVGFGSDRIELLQYVKGLSERHQLLFPCVPVYGDTVFDKAFLEAHREEIETVYVHLADEASKAVYRSFLRFQIGGRLSDLESAISKREVVFSDILPLSAQESYLDLGAYRGDTIAEFLEVTGGQYQKITAVEPNAKTFAKLTAYVVREQLDRCELHNVAVADTIGTLPFCGDGRHNAAAKDGTAIQTVTVDSLCTPSAPFTYIKADIEGLELQMLEGAKETLRTYKPKLNLAVYHKSEDSFVLANRLLQIEPSYKLYFRKHGGFPFWDFNLYAI